LKSQSFVDFEGRATVATISGQGASAPESVIMKTTTSICKISFISNNHESSA